jgi:hypothetical protein
MRSPRTLVRAVGDTAEVTFEVRLDHTWGSESRSGTCVCVNEGGEWRLDRLENARTVRVCPTRFRMSRHRAVLSL